MWTAAWRCNGEPETLRRSSCVLLYSPTRLLAYLLSLVTRHSPGCVDAEKGADRQSGRDRVASPARLPGSGDPGGGRLQRGRPRFPAGAAGGGGGLHRPAAERPELQQHPGDHQCGADHRGGRDPPRLRLPLGERLSGRCLRAGGADLHRAARRGDREDGRQGAGAQADERGGAADAPRQRGAAAERPRRAGDRPEDRLPDHPQGGGGGGGGAGCASCAPTANC